jgi:subtilisin-like proprotein convertase family protein
MKINQVKAAVGGLMLWTAVALGQTSETNFTFSVNQAIPDGNVLGMTLATNLSITGGNISSVTVGLDITGGFNGDLYAYLAGPNGGFAVLLNRVGVSNNATAFGYSDGGFNVTFSDAAANSIQYYQNYTNPAGGRVLGSWQPEGITIDPLTNNPTAFFGAPQNAMLGSFAGTDPNGTWTLFVADMSAGGTGTIVSWNLDVVTVPEPQVWMLGLACLALLAGWRKSDRPANSGR